MPSSNHATRGSGGGYCCNCSSAVGDAVKVQPTNCDGETWCPRCWVWKRCAMEPDRWQAHRTAACVCQFCGWTVVCFGVRPMFPPRCSHCGRPGARLIRPTDEDLKAAIRGVQETAEDEGLRRV